MGMTLSPMVGMGSNGGGIGGGGAQMSLPMLLQMLQHGGGGMGGAPMPGGPMAGVMPHTPPVAGATQAPPMIPPSAPAQGPQGMGSMMPALAQMAGGGQGGLLQMLSGGQSGVAPQGSPQMAPAVLPGMSGGGAANPLINLPLLLRSMGFGGGFTGGAPT